MNSNYESPALSDDPWLPEPLHSALSNLTHSLLKRQSPTEFLLVAIGATFRPPNLAGEKVPRNVF